jgi:type IV fimbrial biogenesis protein FimT
MKTQAAFTLIEMIVTIVLVITIAMMALPNLRATILDYRIVTKANQLVASVNFARTGAITRMRSYVIVRENNDWSQGWEVQEINRDSNKVMKVFLFPTDQITISESGNNSQIGTFDLRGRIGSGMKYEFKVCNPTYIRGRIVSINQMGMVSVKRCSLPPGANSCTSCN